MKIRTPTHGRLARRLIGFSIAAITATRVLGADDLPAFEPGVWTYTVNIMTPGSSHPHVQTMRKCTNPTEDIRRKWRALAIETCKFSPIAHDGKRYTYTSTCQKASTLLSLKAVITVESARAYRVDTESRTNNQVRKEVLTAKREGDCPAASGHMPIPQPRKDRPTGS